MMNQEPQILPLSNYVLLRPNRRDKVGELYVPESAEAHYLTWQTHAAGPEVKQVEVGMRVIVRPQSQIFDVADELFLVAEDDIIGMHRTELVS